MRLVRKDPTFLFVVFFAPFFEERKEMGGEEELEGGQTVPPRGSRWVFESGVYYMFVCAASAAEIFFQHGL